MARDPKPMTDGVAIEGAEEVGVGGFAPLAPLAPVTDNPVVGFSISTPAVVSSEVDAPRPTAPRAMSMEGFELDEWGLPRVGPVRVAVLAQQGRVDPNIDPTGWVRVDAPALPKE